MSRPGEKTADLLDERPDEEQQLLQRNELTKRHEVHLLIDAGDRPVLPNEKRGVVVRLRLVIHLIAAEQQLDTRLAHDGANPLAAGLVVQERKRRGRLGPDDELRPLCGGLARQRQIGVQDVVGLRAHPTSDPAEYFPESARPEPDGLARPAVAVFEASIAPYRHADEHGGGDANGDDRSART